MNLKSNTTTKKHPRRWAMTVVEKLTGLKYATLFGVWAGMVLFFALLYFLLSFIGDGQHGPNFSEHGIDILKIHNMPLLQGFYNTLYYSVITATSTGYGDIVPHGFSKIVASVQSITALFVFAVFVTKLVSHRQELSIIEVHKLTFEDVFHNSREGMYIARKDFDHTMRYLEEYGTIDNEHWENLVTAYRQLQTLFEEIPDFYENENHRYTIDQRREELLLEAVHRTLHRINQMLDLMSIKNIDWTAHERSFHELSELIHIVDTITPLWQNRSPYGLREAFEDILQMRERVHLKMLNAVV